MEASLLVVAASVAAATTWVAAEQGLALFSLMVAAALVIGHGVATASSNRLQPEAADGYTI